MYRVTVSSEPRRDVECFPDRGAMMRAVAERIVERARDAIASRGRFLLTLSGGSTPEPLYELLATPAFAQRIEWPRVDVFWSDERCVPRDHRDSNYAMARKSLLDHVPLLADHVHRMRGEAEPAQAAAAYERMLRTFFGDEAGPPARSFDLVLLGMGADGHTASLFPGSAAAREAQRWVVATPGPLPESWRITLTPVVLNAASEVMFLVAGADKAARLREVLEDPQANALPARSIAPTSGALHWLVDAAAATQLRDTRP
jgi:6-phosphogluconolactonase